MTEQELAARVVAGLEAGGATVYQEVTMYRQICDIVAVQGPVIHAVECKRSVTLHLLDQAYRWISYAHYVSIVAPSTGLRNRKIVRAFLRTYGIGWLYPATWGGPFHIFLPPALHRNIRSDLKDALSEGHRTHAPAGTAQGGRYTPWRATTERLVQLVRSTPGIRIKDAVEAIDHHYASAASARNALAKQIRNGLIPQLRNDHGRLYVYD
jgi:hypothetical protein